MEESSVKEEQVKELFEAGAHFAYSKSRRHPSAKPFIFGAKNNVEIFDLEKTLDALKKAQDFIKEISKNHQILFVGNKNEAKAAIKNAAMEAEMPYVANRWIGGTLTNFSEIRKRIERFEDLSSQKEKGELGKYTKKERLLIDREIDSLEKIFSGLVSMKKLPGVLFVIDPRREKTAISEAKRKKIPVVALANSDCNLKSVDYFIPANDASVSSIRFFVQKIVEAIEEGKQNSASSEPES